MWWIPLAIIGVIVLWAITSYNGLVQARNQVKNGWAQIDVQLKRRFDLIPNLVETVKGYAKHEQETFEKVIRARNAAMGATTVEEMAAKEGELRQTLRSLFALSESYPELKANENFLKLQDELSGTENRISVERNKFNQTAQDFNSYIRQFPRVIYSSWFGFKSKGYFSASPGSESAPKVEF